MIATAACKTESSPTFTASAGSGAVASGFKCDDYQQAVWFELTPDRCVHDQGLQTANFLGDGAVVAKNYLNYNLTARNASGSKLGGWYIVATTNQPNIVAERTIATFSKFDKLTASVLFRSDGEIIFYASDQPGAETFVAGTKGSEQKMSIDRSGFLQVQGSVSKKLP